MEDLLNQAIGLLSDIKTILSFLSGFLVGKQLFKWLGG